MCNDDESSVCLIDNQVLLNSTLDLLQSQKDNRLNRSNLSEKSNSNRRTDTNHHLYHLVRVMRLMKHQLRFNLHDTVLGQAN